MKKNVLVFPCGSEIGLEVNRALANSSHFALYGSNSVDDHGKFVYENYIPVDADIDSVGFIDELNEIIDCYKIDFIIPAHDSAVVLMAENQLLINATVITSEAETCRICRSKGKTYEVFKGLIPTPFLFDPKFVKDFPLFLKPDVGQGSKGTYKVNCQEELDFYLQKDPTLLVLEYLPGKEYTIDCFTNRNGELLFAEGRIRNRISNGISVNSRVIINDTFLEFARIISANLKFRGVWFFQLKEREDGEMVLMEISPRIAGTMGLFRAAGVNFTQLSLFDRMNYDVSVIYNDFEIEIDRALIGRFKINLYYDYVYLDFDDTVIVDDKVYTTIIKFLYQAKNHDKKIILITKHKYDILETLNRFAISHLLFDEIIQLSKDQCKCNFILHRNAVFIDDSFSERQEILQKLNIPTFGLDAIESLLYWKS